MQDSGPAAVYNDTIHGLIRLRICGILSESGMTEFRVLRDSLGVADSVLSKHLKKLEQSGFVHLTKGTVDSRRRTWLTLTNGSPDMNVGQVGVLWRGRGCGVLVGERMGGP